MAKLEGNAYFMEKSLNENGCSFDILDKKEFRREGGDKFFKRKLPKKTLDACSCKKTLAYNTH